MFLHSIANAIENYSLQNKVVQCFHNRELFPHTECVVLQNKVVQCFHNRELFPHTECVVLQNKVVQFLEFLHDRTQ